MIHLQFGEKLISCKGIIFDKDGTLIDSFKIWPNMIKSRIRILQGEVGFNEELVRILEKALGLGENGEVIRRSPMVIATREQTAAAVNGVLFLYLGIPWDTGMEKVKRAFNLCDLEMKLETQAVPITGALKVLNILAGAGIKIAVATNDELDRTRSLMAHAGLASCISAYACSDEVKEGKPAPDLLYLVSERLGLALNDCVVVGDSLLDIQMGINAGVKLNVGVLTGASTKEELISSADVVIPSVGNICVGEKKRVNYLQSYKKRY